MDPVSFNQEPQYANRFAGGPAVPYFVRLVMSLGIAKDQRQAEYVLIGVIVLSIIAAIFFFSVASGGGEELSPAEIQRIQNTTQQPLRR